MASAKKIRLGMINCDIHGWYFGLMMQKCNPQLLLKNYEIVHYYASNIYDGNKLTFPKVSGFEIVKIWDKDRKMAEKFASTFLNKPQICDTIEDMTTGVDALFLGDGEGSGNDHLVLATPGLKKKIPMFIDKPFAMTLSDAIEIVKLAKKYKTPIFNASILTHVPAADQFKRRFEEIANAYYPVPSDKPALKIGFGTVKGVGGTFSQELAGKAITGGLEDRMAYIIHGVSLALNLFGKGVEWLEVMGELPLEYIHLRLKSGTDVMIMNSSTDVFPESCSFYASAYSKYGAVHSNAIGDPQFIGGGKKILEIFRKMIRTGKAPLPYRDFIEPIAIIEAAQIAQKKGKRIYMKDVWKDN